MCHASLRKPSVAEDRKNMELFASILKPEKTMKIITSLLLLSAISCMAAPTVLHPVEGKINGRVQYEAVPGSGDGSLKLVDEALPAEAIRVGPTANEGVGLGYLIAFETDEAARESILLGEPVRLELDVTDVSRGGTPEDAKVVFLLAGGNPDTEWIQYRAWNPAFDFSELGTISRDPLVGPVSFDVTEAVSDARNFPTAEDNLLWFAVYVDDKTLLPDNSGRHIVFSGSGEDRPRLVIGE